MKFRYIQIIIILFYTPNFYIYIFDIRTLPATPPPLVWGPNKKRPLSLPYSISEGVTGVFILSSRPVREMKYMILILACLSVISYTLSKFEQLLVLSGCHCPFMVRGKERFLANSEGKQQVDQGTDGRRGL